MADGIEIACGEEMIIVDELLVATGREPNSDLLDAAAGGIELGDRGTIVVDDTMATNVEGVWAIGDIANDQQLKHLANAEAKVAFWNIAHPDDRPPAELQGGAERRVLQPAGGDGRPDRAASDRTGPAVRRRSSASTRAPPTGGRSSTRRRSPRCSSTSTTG